MKYLKTLFSELDKIDFNIIKAGSTFCFIILILSIILLINYIITNNFFLYNLGISIFKLSTYIFIEFIICGIVMDKIKKETF